MTLLLGSELSSEVDTPVEVDTNSLSISAAAYFAFYCLFLAAFYFWCKLCNWPWEWFHSSLGRAEMHSGAPMKGFSHTNFLTGIPIKASLKDAGNIEQQSWDVLRCLPGCCLGSENGNLWQHWNCLGFFVVPLIVFRICPKWWSLCFDTLWCLAFFLEWGIFSLMSWNWKKRQHCVPAPLVMHSVTVNLESTKSLNTTTQKSSDKQDPEWGWDAFAIACHQHSVTFAAPFLGHVPQKREQVSLGHRNYACSKNLWWGVLGMPWNCAWLPWASVRQSVEELSRDI